MYRNNRHEPTRVADIYKRHKNYFDYVVKQLEYFSKYEKKDKIKKSYKKIIDLVKNRKKKILKAKPKKINEKFVSSVSKNNNLMMIILMLVILWLM